MTTSLLIRSHLPSLQAALFVAHTAHYARTRTSSGDATLMTEDIKGMVFLKRRHFVN